MLNNIVGFLGEGVAASTNSYESIATATSTGSSGTITFTSIPSTYKHLQLRAFLNNNNGNISVTTTFNSDTGANYAQHSLYGDGSSVTATSSTSRSNISAMFYTGNATSTYWPTIVDILDYADTNKYKVARSLSGGDFNGSGYILFMSSLWQSTSAINSITVTNFASGVNFSSGSTIALYGVKG